MEVEWVEKSGRQRLRLEGAVELCPVIRHCIATTYISSYRALCCKTVIHEQGQVDHEESNLGLISVIESAFESLPLCSI